MRVRCVADNLTVAVLVSDDYLVAVISIGPGEHNNPRISGCHGGTDTSKDVEPLMRLLPSVSHQPKLTDARIPRRSSQFYSCASEHVPAGAAGEILRA